MLTDSSDSADNLVDKYDPKVDLPDIIPCQQLKKNKSEPVLSEREKLMIETRKMINEEYSDKTPDSGTFELEKKEKPETRKKTKKRIRKVKDAFVFKPAQLEKRKKDDDNDDMKAIELSLNQDINEDEIPDVFEKSDKEEESEGPTVTGNWKAQEKNIATEVIKPKRVNPRVGIMIKKAHKSGEPMKTVSCNEIRPPVAPPDPSITGKGKRPIIKRKSKSTTSEEHSGSEREESISNGSGSQEKVNSNRIQDAISKAISTTSETNQEETENKEKPTKTAPPVTKLPVKDTVQARKPNKIQKKIEIIRTIQTTEVMKFSTFICSLEDQGKLTKRRFIKIFRDSKPLYSVKIKNILTDGNIGVSVGGDPHIAASEHVGTIIVANDKTDYSLRNGTYQGQELITIRTTINQNDGKSGHALFIHGIQGISPIELYGYYRGDRALEFRKKDSKEVYATFSMLTSSTINVNCCDFIDAMRAFAVCFALFMTMKK